MVAVLLLAGGALTGIHLLHANTSAPLPAQLSTSDAGGGPGSVPPVEQIPPAPQTAPAPGQPAPTTAASRNPAGTQAPAQHLTTTTPDRDSGGDGADNGTNPTDGDSDRWHGNGDWHDPEGFPRRDQYPFRPREGFGQHSPGFSNRPGQTGLAAPAAPSQGDQARQQVANAICDRYHISRDHCQIDSPGQ